MSTAHAVQPPRIPVWTLGDRLRKARTAAGITVPGMSARLLDHGIQAGKSTVGNWETGASLPRPHGHNVFDVARAWATITGVPVAWLLGLPSDTPASEDRFTSRKPHSVRFGHTSDGLSRAA